jgi:hypothetical protein
MAQNAACGRIRTKLTQHNSSNPIDVNRPPDTILDMSNILTRRVLLQGTAVLSLALGLTHSHRAFASETASSAGSLRGGVAFVGHSLVSPILPALFAQMAPDTTVSYQVINGAPLSANWEHHLSAEGISVRNLLATGAVDYLVLAEGGPIEGSISAQRTREMLQSWRAQGVSANPSMKTYWYQIWPAIPGYDISPDYVAWRTEIEALSAIAYGVVMDQVSSDLGDKRIYLSPVGEAFATLSLAVENAEIRDIADFTEVFFPTDDIHPSVVGFYFVALVHFAVLAQRNPKDLKWKNFVRQYGAPFDTHHLTEAAAADMADLAWDVVSNHPYAGIAARPVKSSSEATIGTGPTHWSGQSDGALTTLATGVVAVGPPRPDRMLIVFVSIFAAPQTLGSEAVVFDPGGKYETTLTQLAQAGEQERILRVYAAELPSDATGEADVTVTAADGGWSLWRQSAFVVDGGDFEKIRPFSGPSAPMQVAGDTGEALLVAAMMWGPSNDQPIVFEPDIAEMENSLMGGDPAVRLAWGTLRTSIYSTFAIGGSHTEKLAVLIPPKA